MSSFVLKLIAIVSMLIDHIGVILIPRAEYPELYLLFRGIGRLAFPIFVFLIVEGFHHTKNVKKYLQRLGIFALISEIPFDIAFYRGYFIEDLKTLISAPNNTEIANSFLNKLTSHQNVFFTLFLGLLCITLMDRVEKKFQQDMLVSNILDAFITIVTCLIAFVLKTDYHYAGILLIVAFYLFRQSKLLMALSLLFISGSILSNFNHFFKTGQLSAIISVFATLAIIPISLYNGKKGKNAKYIFYIFYPAHLIILFLISIYL